MFHGLEYLIELNSCGILSGVEVKTKKENNCLLYLYQEVEIIDCITKNFRLFKITKN